MKYIPPPNLEFLDKKGEGYYACSHCNTHVGLIRDLESKTFQGRAGRAFLFKHLSNVKLGPGEYRELSTGHRIGVDISCFKCQKVIGWKYVH
ncbi:hypothetical protein HMI55_002148 [Coelomomyces lativittatus]|nr:hypothetical protein HMI55_002148 [Coelomomyces lativittatus]